jgi:hypothetical protein
MMNSSFHSFLLDLKMYHHFRNQVISDNECHHSKNDSIVKKSTNMTGKTNP